MKERNMALLHNINSGKGGKHKSDKDYRRKPKHPKQPRED